MKACQKNLINLGVGPTVGVLKTPYLVELICEQSLFYGMSLKKHCTGILFAQGYATSFHYTVLLTPFRSRFIFTCRTTKCSPALFNIMTIFLLLHIQIDIPVNVAKLRAKQNSVKFQIMHPSKIEKKCMYDTNF